MCRNQKKPVVCVSQRHSETLCFFQICHKELCVLWNTIRTYSLITSETALSLIYIPATTDSLTACLLGNERSACVAFVSLKPQAVHELDTLWPSLCRMSSIRSGFPKNNLAGNTSDDLPINSVSLKQPSLWKDRQDFFFSFFVFTLQAVYCCNFVFCSRIA